MDIHSTPLIGVYRVTTKPYQDQRGQFVRWFCQQGLNPILNNRQILQINFSQTWIQGAVRGLHFQHPPHAEMKLIRCVRGQIFDVVVDLRAGSPTLLQWHGVYLSAEEAVMLVIPEGCAHGFQVLEADSELLYLHTAFYQPAAEGGIRCDDPRLGIAWPLPVADLSSRDREHPWLSTDFSGIAL